MRDAYPVYDGHHRAHVATIRRALERIPNLQFAGRNGLHRYDNMDDAMLTGLLAARSVLGGARDA
jgi:protoporphyrinogen oxidase